MKITNIILVLVAVGVAFLIYNTTSTQQIVAEENPDQWLVEYTNPDDLSVNRLLGQIVLSDGVLSVKDVYDLQEWVATNIEYESTGPKYPSMTISSQQGNCWSQARRKTYDSSP